MKILMLGNSFTSVNDLPRTLAELTGAQVVRHTRGGAWLAEQLNPESRMGAKTQAALREERWDYVVLQERSNGPITAPQRFFDSVERLSRQARQSGAVPILYATWAYRRGSGKLESAGLTYDEMYHRLYTAYHRAAEQSRALIADVGQRFYDLADREELYAADGVHPNALGSRIAAETIAEVIRRQEAK